jgi:2-oxoisovalerate dehydrogenase E1 component alpha subunit
MVVTNNQWGISTPAKTQHAEHFISDRAKAFGIKTSIVNGLDPEESYIKIKEAMQYVRTERKPFLIEAFVSRLYGHSSASGANFVSDEPDPLKLIEEKMETRKLFTRDQMKKTWDQYNEEMLELVKKVREEPQPDPKSIWNYIYCGEKTKQERF